MHVAVSREVVAISLFQSKPWNPGGLAAHISNMLSAICGVVAEVGGFWQNVSAFQLSTLEVRSRADNH